ncbi:nucleoside monophosphate kinase [Polymorphospora rubra]|uniref:Adenylate kinase n=1 Tax=Polymorphospora rubra TaxID=338584 RepID=A0A810N5I0_9ACTN|nr:nucleoside monophosphate kinase [Polymorphospora rubra]BCJ68557.1 adenylate kinase [Polymorphospora rubra]
MAIAPDVRRIALIRAPGADVHSPAEILAGQLGLRPVSPGNLFRRHVQHRTPQGLVALQHMNGGRLVPDELIVDLLAETLSNAKSGWVLAGFPRRVEQAELLAERGHPPEMAVELTITPDEVDVSHWATVTGRPPDERRAQLAASIADYRETAEPLRAHYRRRGILRNTSAYGGPEEVADRIRTLLAG